MQHKPTQHTKIEEISTHEKRQQMIHGTKMTQMLKLSDKDFKAAIIQMFQQAIMNALETNRKTESFSKGIEGVRKNKMEILELNNN